MPSEFDSILQIGLVLGAIFVFIWLLNTLRGIFRIVQQNENLVILTLGTYSKTLGPGLRIIIPGFQRAISVDMRELFLDIPSQTAITKDNAPLAIDFLVYMRITDPRKAVLEVVDARSAAVNMATTILRAVIGDISLDDVLSKREQINDTLRVKLDETTERWGLKITNVEIREIQPPRDVQDAMNRQMTAERERRAVVTRASGEREAAIAVAEGEKQAAVLRAEGDKQAAILKAQGEREAQLLKAQGFAKALEAIYAEAREIDQNTLLLQYMDTLREVGKSNSTKFVIPMEITNMMQQLSGIMNTQFLDKSTGKEVHKSESNGVTTVSGD